MVKNKLLDLRSLFWRHHPDLNWGIKLLQSFALPLGYGATRLSTPMSVRNSRTPISLERETRYSLPALTVEHCFHQLRESYRFADSRTRGCRARRFIPVRCSRTSMSLERETRFELATFALARQRSTTEPLSHFVFIRMVRMKRLELPCRGHRILSPARLPIPPHPLVW